MVMTASKLRANIYRVLDQVLDTGIPVEIERRGKRLKLVPVDVPDKFANLVERPDFLQCDPEDLVHMDWYAEWDQGEALDLS
jgi:prevent-host-death family protein